MREKTFKYIWIFGLYATLLIALYLIIEYKVKWEERDLNDYLYIYDCNNNICSTTNEIKKYYSKIKCNEHKCPYIKEINDNVLILKDESSEFLYDYKKLATINNYYITYNRVGTNYIVSDENNMQGVINLNGDVLVDLKYDEIIDYKNEYFIFKVNSLYGVGKGNTTIIEPVYHDISLINDSYFFAKNGDNEYMTYNYDNIVINDKKYEYAYSVGDYSIVILNEKLDILDKNMNSLLVLKIDTYIDYSIIKNQSSLNIYLKNNEINFTVKTLNNENINYKYNIIANKLIS